jgi:hypothetical protein
MYFNDWRKRGWREKTDAEAWLQPISMYSSLPLRGWLTIWLVVREGQCPASVMDHPSIR